jgi:tRNA N6-adenosine threonylcarbamoyltransferase
VRILGIESSCDETAAAVVEDGQLVHSNVIHSQVAIHQRFGGVVPEIASRDHLRRAVPVVERALLEAGIDRGDIDGVAVTQGPGLIGSLLVGLQTAKALAFALDKPLMLVNHVEAHTDAVFLRPRDESAAAGREPSPPPPPFPHVALAASGGHSSLYLVRDHGRHELVGYTMDDAAGEAFDKVAKLLGLPYPGGVSIDRLSELGDPKAIRFPRPRINNKPHLFSFSGLKTAVRYHIDQLGRPVSELNEKEIADIAVSFQEAVCDVLIQRSLDAARAHCPPGAGAIVVAGGVAANRRLRALFAERAAAAGHSLHLTPRAYCTDNAAMIAGLGYHLHQRGEIAPDPLAADAFSSLNLKKKAK